MELNLQSLFKLLCAAVLIGLDPATPPPPPTHLRSYTRALLVTQERRHLFVTPPWDTKPLRKVLNLKLYSFIAGEQASKD
jgi:hypothetical protein